MQYGRIGAQPRAANRADFNADDRLFKKAAPRVGSGRRASKLGHALFRHFPHRIGLIGAANDARRCCTPTTRPGKAPGIPGLFVAALLFRTVDAAKPAYLIRSRRGVMQAYFTPRPLKNAPAESTRDQRGGAFWPCYNVASSRNVESKTLRRFRRFRRRPRCRAGGRRPFLARYFFEQEGSSFRRGRGANDLRRKGAGTSEECRYR